MTTLEHSATNEPTLEGLREEIGEGAEQMKQGKYKGYATSDELMDETR